MSVGAKNVGLAVRAPVRVTVGPPIWTDEYAQLTAAPGAVAAVERELEGLLGLDDTPPASAVGTLPLTFAGAVLIEMPTVPPPPSLPVTRSLYFPDVGSRYDLSVAELLSAGRGAEEGAGREAGAARVDDLDLRRQGGALRALHGDRDGRCSARPRSP